MVSQTIIALGALGLLAIVIAKSQNVFASKSNDLPTLKELLDQQEINLGTTQGIIGAQNLPEGKSLTASTVKANIVTGNLFTEDALRKLIASENNVQSSATITSAGTEVTTKRNKSLDISTSKSLELFRSDTSSLVLHDSFNPIGDSEVLGVQNKLIGKNFIGRKQEFFSGTLTTKAGGTRNIIGSEALFKRLQENLNKSSGA